MTKMVALTTTLPIICWTLIVRTHQRPVKLLTIVQLGKGVRVCVHVCEWKRKQLLIQQLLCVIVPSAKNDQKFLVSFSVSC